MNPKLSTTACLTAQVRVAPARQSPKFEVIPPFFSNSLNTALLYSYLSATGKRSKTLCAHTLMNRRIYSRNSAVVNFELMLLCSKGTLF